MTYTEKDSKREWPYVYPIHYAIQQKVTQRRKLAVHVYYTPKNFFKERISVGLLMAELQVKMNFTFDYILFYCHIQGEKAARSLKDTGEEKHPVAL